MKNLLMILTFICFSAFNSVNAQYSEIWNAAAGASDNILIGCQNMDNDAAKEIVILDWNNENFYIFDGLTGSIEWQSPEWNFIKHDLDVPDYGPRLIDVNNNGTYELLFYGSESGGGVKFYLYGFGGSANVAEFSSLNNNNISNYPNPFLNTTTIKYTVPTDNSLVLIKIFDSYGNELKTLVNEKKVAGNYEIVFNGFSFSSGVYYYQVIIGNNVGTKTMIKIE